MKSKIKKQLGNKIEQMIEETIATKYDKENWDHHDPVINVSIIFFLIISFLNFSQSFNF
jgi:hypothetical protein